MCVVAECCSECSGAGKSTVAALLSRFYAPQSGEVLLNGQPASSFTRGEWARAVSVVQQEPVLFGGTQPPSPCTMPLPGLPCIHMSSRSAFSVLLLCLARHLKAL